MIPFDEALRRVLAHCEPLDFATVPVGEALGRVLAEEVATARDLPGFDNSAVDGFGVRVADVAGATPARPVPLPCDHTVRAGDDAGGYALAAGRCVKLLTGAAVPEGVEAVVMKEHAAEKQKLVEVQRSARLGDNIRRRGEEYAGGAIVLEPGTPVTPPVVGLLVSVGRCEVRVYRSPRVTVAVTGDELVPPGEELREGRIYESNSYALAACLRGAGVQDITALHLPDDYQRTLQGLNKALVDSEVVITVGGVSVGDYDFVKAALAELGVCEVYWQVNMKPGKPNYFGVHEPRGRCRTLIFGLPGNPVSAQVSFHKLVRPALWALTGRRIVESPRVTATLAHPLPRKGGRREFVRAVLSQEGQRTLVRACRGQGSHMQGGLAEANCLIDVPECAGTLPAGADVVVDLLTWM